MINTRLMKYMFNFWPPFIGAGISVKYLSPDYREATIALKLRWYNRNWVNAHFGGSLYAMTDPFYMFMLLHILGKNYIVWDKTGRIDYVTPGKGTVTAHFKISNEQIDEIKQRTKQFEPFLPEYVAEVRNTEGDVIANVSKKLYIRRKKHIEAIV